MEGTRVSIDSFHLVQNYADIVIYKTWGLVSINPLHFINLLFFKCPFFFFLEGGSNLSRLLGISVDTLTQISIYWFLWHCPHEEHFYVAIVATDCRLLCFTKIVSKFGQTSLMENLKNAENLGTQFGWASLLGTSTNAYGTLFALVCTSMKGACVSLFLVSCRTGLLNPAGLYYQGMGLRYIKYFAHIFWL